MNHSDRLKTRPSSPLSSPMVSVILPTYNRDWSIVSAVESVLAQTYSNLELIVVDDGSTDRTPALLAPFRKKIRLIRQENRGVSAARNTGIRASRGSLIALLDSDDLWERDKISCQVEFFKQNPRALICQTEEIWIRNGRRVNPKKKHRKPSGMIFEASLHLCLVSPSAVMMRKELFDIKGVFNETMPVCEDYDLWLRVSCDTPVYRIDRACTIKRGGHEDQLSANHSQDKYRIASLDRLIRSGCLTPEQTQKAVAVLRKKAAIYGQGCVKRGRAEEGEYYLGLSTRKTPPPGVPGLQI